MNYKEYFKDKNIAIVGLGQYGEMIPDIKFLKALKANITIYDPRSESKLRPIISKMAPNLKKLLLTGSIPSQDLALKDLIILSSDINSKSLFLRKAREAGVPIEYQEILFLKYSPNITLLGIAGSYGKTSISKMLNSIFKQSLSLDSNQSLFYIDHESSSGYISNLKKIKPGDIVLSEIPEHMIKEYRKARINPHIAVITSLTSTGEGGDNEVFGLLEYQTYNNFIIAPDIVIDNLRKRAGFTARAKIFRTRVGIVPNNWNLSKHSPHDLENLSLVLQVCEILKIEKDTIRLVIEKFKGIKGHMEYVKNIRGIDFYNDGASISPYATENAIINISNGNEEKSIVLILGGAYTGYEYDRLINIIKTKVKTVICLPGSGTVGFRNMLLDIHDLNFKQVLNIEEAIKYIKDSAIKGDKVVFSPACLAIGLFENRIDRIEKFNKMIKSFK